MIFKDLNEAIKYFAEKLYFSKPIESTNKINYESYKNELGGELIQQFFTIENSKAVIGTYENHKPYKWWMYGECLSEILNLDPPIMYKYKPELFNKHYKLLDDGRMQYSYGSRWYEFNQLNNIYNKFKENPNSKRCVIDIFTPYDTAPDRTDCPCTTMYHFIQRDGKLHMSVFMRSWDFFGGFKTYDEALSSFIQQSLCSWLDFEPGNLSFYVNSLHYYNKDKENLEKLLNEDDRHSEIFEIDKKMDIAEYYKELRLVKLSEEHAYSKNFYEANKIKDSLSLNLFKDMSNTFIEKNKLRYKRSENEKTS